MMNRLRAALVVASAIGLSGCATVLEGTEQIIHVRSNPSEAVCTAERQGVPVGSVGPGGRTLTVSKSRHDIVLTCSAKGYDTETVMVQSSVTAGGVASIMIFDFGITDYATGALNKYPDSVSVNLRSVGGR